ncbi:MAG: AMP-binding protein [Desulfobacterales bacterium]|nr:MAG: AMP-binding protein [Desulfobacterales bacterium]
MHTLGDIPKWGARNYADRPAVVYDKVRLTYKELNDRTNRVAHALTGLGCRRGDRLAVLAENSHKYLEIYLAAGKLGMSLNPLNFMLPEADLIHMVNDSEASLLMVGNGYEACAARMKRGLKTIRNWVTLDGKRKGFLDYEDLLKTAPRQEPDVNVEEDEMAALIYTSGTTGVPKGVMLSHRNIITTAWTTTAMMDLSPADCGCFVLPFFQTEIFYALCLLMAGGKIAINRKAEQSEILRLIQNEKCTHINLVPAIYDWLRQYPEIDQFDISSIRIMSYTGGAFAPDVLSQCVKKFWKRFAQGYGMTETSGCAVTVLKSDDHVLEGPRSKLLASAGKPSKWAEVRVVDSDDVPVKPQEIGEVVIRGQNVMMGYWKNPELTRTVLRNGWFHTGDIGYLDEEGYLFVVGRKASQRFASVRYPVPKSTDARMAI